MVAPGDPAGGLFESTRQAVLDEAPVTTIATTLDASGSVGLHLRLAYYIGLVEIRTRTRPILLERPGRNENLTNKNMRSFGAQSTRDEPRGPRPDISGKKP